MFDMRRSQRHRMWSCLSRLFGGSLRPTLVLNRSQCTLATSALGVGESLTQVMEVRVLGPQSAYAEIHLHQIPHGQRTLLCLACLRRPSCRQTLHHRRATLGSSSRQRRSMASLDRSSPLFSIEQHRWRSRTPRATHVHSVPMCPFHTTSAYTTTKWKFSSEQKVISLSAGCRIMSISTAS